MGGYNKAERELRKVIGSMDKAKILVIDDEQGIRDLLKFELSLQGYKVDTAEDGAAGIEKIKHEKFDLVISDIKMPKLDGVQTLGKIKEIDPNIEVIMATGFGTIETAVASMKKGAYDYISKPFNIEEVSVLIEKALEKHEIKNLLSLYEISKAIFSSLDLNQLLDIAVNVLKDVLNTDEIMVFLYNDKNQLCISSHYGVDEKQKQDQRFSMCRDIINTWSFDKNESFAYSKTSKDAPRNLGIADNVNSMIVYPIKIKNQNLGFLYTARINASGDFNNEDLRALSIVVSNIVQAIENAKLYDNLENKVNELGSAYKMLEKQKDQLIEMEKLSAVGKLASGVAHEINNPLMVILGFTEVLLKELKNPDGTKEKLQTIHDQAGRCRQIIQNLLLFSKQRPAKKELVNVNDIINDVLHLLSYELKTKDIKVSTNLMSGVPKIYAESVHVRQVFLNIMSNAIWFIDENKKEHTIDIRTKRNQDKLLISFVDNGPGISKENKKHVFDPFFTTKDVQEGAGLGLSLCYGIVKEYGGTITVESQPGRGTSINVEFDIHK